MHTRKPQMNAMVGRMREARLDVAFQFTPHHAGQGGHLETGVAEFVKRDGLADGVDQQKNSRNREDQHDVRDCALLLGRLGQDEKGNRHRDEIPENRENPARDRVGASFTVGAALGPVFAPKPWFRGMFGLAPLLTLQLSGAVEGDEN